MLSKPLLYVIGTIVILILLILLKKYNIDRILIGNKKYHLRENVEKEIVKSEKNDIEETRNDSKKIKNVKKSDVQKVDITPVVANIYDTKVSKKVKSGKFESKGEKECRRFMEEVYGTEFKNVRPNWLKNPKTKRNLEIDVYSEILKIGVEYNGIQHYKWPNFTGQSKEEFEKQKERDELKKTLCKKRGVHLIIVPYNVQIDKIGDYIFEHLPEDSKNIIREVSQK